MSIRGAHLQNVMSYIIQHNYQERQKMDWRLDLSCLGNSSLHDMCASRGSENLSWFLRSFKGSVDIVDPASGVTPLVTACKMGDLNAVKLLVQYGANVNHRCSGVNKNSLKYSDVTPIFVAAQEGHESVVEYLGRQGADVNIPSLPMGLTPLHQAVLLRHAEVVSVLVTKLEAKVSIPCIERPAAYPIHHAIVYREPFILETILSAEDADVNVSDPTENVTALHIASYDGDFTSVGILIKHGANINVQLKSGHTPLDLATQEKKRHVMELLKGYGARRGVHDKSWHPFLACVMNGLMSLKAAVNRGADIHSSLQKGATALHYCVVQGRMDSCKFLVRKGANLESKDIYGSTPLHLAAQLGLNVYVDFLLEKGANVNAQSNLQYTPLHMAVVGGHAITCKLLLSKGADIESLAWGIGSPLIGAIANAHAGVIKLLLNSGANPNARNIAAKNIMTPLHVAVYISSHKSEILKALVEAGADVRDHIHSDQATISPLHVLLALCKNVESLRIMIEAGAYLDSLAVSSSKNANTSTCYDCYSCRDWNHCTLPWDFSGTPLQMGKHGGNPNLVRLLENTLELFKAVRKNDLDLAEKHFALGGLVNCCSVRYDTPLIYASWKGYVDMVKFLLRNGAKIDMNNVQNSSPLHYAAKYNQKDVAIQLLKAGAPIDLVRCNKTPLELAQEAKHLDIANLLDFVLKYLKESGKKIAPFPAWKTDPVINRLISESGGKVLDKDLEVLFSL